MNEISLSGLESIFIPFAIEFVNPFTLIEFENIRTADEFITTLTNIFHAENYFEKGQLSKRLTNITEHRKMYRVRFKTCKNEYLLWKYFIGFACTEFVIQKVGTDIFFSGKDAVDKLRQISKPVILVNGDFHSDKSTIFKPYSEYQRKELMRMVNTWLKSIKCGGNVEIRFDGNWHFTENRDFFIARNLKNHIPSFVSLLINLAQSIMRKNVFGETPIVFNIIKNNELNQYEIVSVINLVKSISQLNNIHFVILFESFTGCEMLNPILTPRIEGYFQ